MEGATITPAFIAWTEMLVGIFLISKDWSIPLIGPYFSVDVDLHGPFSTDWMKQKVVYATSPETNIRYLLSDLLHAQLLGSLFSFEIMIFGTIEDDFRKKTQKVNKMFTHSGCS